MAKPPRGTRSRSVKAAVTAPQTGATGAYVVRFKPGAAKQGLRVLESHGLTMASAAELTRAGTAPTQAGAGMIFFERFGIAIIDEEPGRVRAAIAAAATGQTIADQRPERVYHASAEVRLPSLASGLQAFRGQPRDVGYLTGYRDAVNDLVERLLADASGMTARTIDETTLTWGLEACAVPASRWSGAGIKVAVLDTGFDAAHPDFLGRESETASFVAGETVDDGNGHGTHCIGTAMGPKAPAGVPRYGVAHGAFILAGKVLSNAGSGTDRSIIAGMEWALDQGAAVISMSLGSAVAEGETWFEDYEQIGGICLDEGCLVVAAAGNESQRPQRIAPVGAPANTPSMMAVAAIDASLAVAPFSCGAINPDQNVDLAAPGVDVLSSFPGGGHRRLNGTSMATPHVAGLAALYAESDAKFRGRALWAILMQRARSLPLPARDIGRGLAQAPS